MEVLMSHPSISTRSAMTGHHAPTSGWWQPAFGCQEPRYVREGEIMPARDGSQILWELIEPLHPSKAGGPDHGQTESSLSLYLRRPNDSLLESKS